MQVKRLNDVTVGAGLSKFVRHRPLIIFDLETTGVETTTDRIVEFCFIKVHPDNRVEMIDSLVNPEMPIPKSASDVHGITDEVVQSCPTMSELGSKIRAFLADCDLGGFNVAVFDIPLLYHELLRVDIDWDYRKNNIIDVRNLYVRNEGRTLTDAYRYYIGETLEDAHQAYVDVKATMDIFNAQLELYPDLPTETSEKLSLYSNFDKERVDLYNKFVVGDEGKIYYNFGKYKGMRAIIDRNYLMYIIRENFPQDTKNVAKAILEGKLK